MNKSVNIAIFASGAGSNALNIIRHFQTSGVAVIKLILSNKPKAGVTDIARQYNIPCLIIEKEPFFTSDKYVHILKKETIDLIVLAGFLWKIPASLIEEYPGRIINIHPALLPKYGGKGMYGQHVHEAVLNAKEPKSGITIHLVDEQYDNGKHLFQAECEIKADDNPDTLADKIHTLEHKHFPMVIEKYINETFLNTGGPQSKK